MTMTLDTITHNADGTVTQGTITIPTPDPNAPRRSRPKPTTIGAAIFYARFTDIEKAAIAAAAIAMPAIFVGLIHGLANGTVDLTSAELNAWMDGLVSLGAITADHKIEILTP